jgi:uncharacterized RDD family membrane protein YckC
MASRESQQGVYYERTDYLGVGKRLLIDVIDVTLAVFASVLLTAIAAFLLEASMLTFALFLVWPGLWFAYFVLLKASRFRTVGYIAAGARIVNLSGAIPGIPSLAIRFLFAAFGPLNTGFDLLWIPSDPAGQALRDKFAHTYVIRLHAQPKGSGRVKYVPYTILGGSFIFPEVSESPQSIAP